MKPENILDQEDRKLLHHKIDADVKCPECGETWHSPYPNTRKTCPECFKKLTGYDYIQQQVNAKGEENGYTGIV